MRNAARRVGGYARQTTQAFFSMRLIYSLAIWWLWMPALFALWGLFLRFGFAAGIGTWYQGYYLFFREDFFAADAGSGIWFVHLGWVGWLWVLIGSIGTVALVFSRTANPDGRSVPEKLTAGVAVIVAITSIWCMIADWTFLDRNKDYFYLQQTTMGIEDIKNPPPSVRLVFEQTNLRGWGASDASEEDKAEARRKHMVYSSGGMTVKIGEQTVVRQATPPADLWQWEPRNSSLAAAKKIFKAQAGIISGVNPMDPTTSYVYGKDPSRDQSKPWAETDEQYSRWSVVMDGSGKNRYAGGVSEWHAGQAQAEMCLFDDYLGENQRKGDNYFRRAFAGTRKNSLRNVLADKYPNLVYEDTDIAGYCEGANGTVKRPVIVVSVKRIVGWRNQTNTVPAGVIELRGSKNGYPTITYKPTVKAGDYPMGVYPLSTVVDQRLAINRWAGNANLNDEKLGFGFQPAADTDPKDGVEVSNNSEFILRSKKDGRLYVVTPLTTRLSLMYSNILVTPADEVTDGQLNHMDSFVLPENSELIVSTKTLYSSARAAIIAAGFNPVLQSRLGGFLSSGNKLEEVTPLSPTKYRFFGVDPAGSTLVYVDIDAAPKNPAPPVAATIDATTGAVGTPVVLNNVDAANPGTSTPANPGTSNGAQPQQPTTTVNCNGKNATTATNAELQTCLTQAQSNVTAYQQELLRRLAAVPTPSVGASSAPTPAGSPSSVVPSAPR